MKKITFLPLLALAVFSCKKETKSITKTDPATGKTVTVEVPANDSAATKAAVENQPAIRDSAGVFYQTFKLETGKTYPLVTVQNDKQTMTAPDGKSQSGSSENVDEMSFTVNGFTNNVYDITIGLLSKRSSQSAGGQTVKVDTKGPEPKEEQLKLMWKVNKALIGNKLNMKMDRNGKVLSITGFDPIYTKVSTATAGIIKDKKAREAFAKNFKESFNQKILSNQFEKNLVILPTKGVKLGAKWTETENATPDGKVKLSSTYTLKSVDDDAVVISVTGGIPYQSEKKTQEGITRTMSSELSQNGKVTLDRKTGWIKNQNIDVKTSQSETLSDGKQSQTMKSVSTSSVQVNP